MIAKALVALPVPRPIRIALFTQFFPAHRGGVEIVAGELAKALAKHSAATITWFASDCDPPPTLKGVSCFPVPAWNPLERHIHLPYPIWSPLSLKALWQAIRNADLVHVHDYIYVGSLAAFWFAKIQRKPVLLTQHVGAVPFRQRLIRWGLTIANLTLGRTMLKKADTAVFVSAVVKDFFLPSEKQESKALLIPNGLDSAIFFPASNTERKALRSALGITGDSLCFLFVGRFVEKKGLGLLKKLTALFPDILWIFAGRGALDPERWSQSNVKVFRHRSGTSLADLYRAADLLVLPSVGEGFPLVVQESMACGTPAMVSIETASALPGIKQVVFAEPVSDDEALSAWSQRLNQFQDSPLALTQRREEVAEWASKHWSWQRCANTYRQVIDSILERRVSHD